MAEAVWREALTGVPRVDEPAWRGLGTATRWLVASRAAVLVMTLLSAVIAGILAWRDGQFDWVPFLALTGGLLAAHAANNILNDLTDHLTGVDRDNSFRTRYGTQPLEAGLMSVRQNLAYFLATALVAALAGAYLTWRQGWFVLFLAGLGAFFLLAYTWPLKHIGLGELSALAVWGPLMIGGGYYALGGRWSWEVVVASLPYALGVTGVLIAKHIDKLDNDRRRGIHTLPVILGSRPARGVVVGLIVLQYAVVVGLVLAGSFGWSLLVVLLGIPILPRLAKVFATDTPAAPPEGYPPSAWPLWYVSFAFVHNRRFGVLYVLGLLVEAVISRIS